MSGTDMIQILASLSSSGIGDSDYVRYFVNQHGNQLVFVQRPGEAQAVLLHSDLRWQPEQISPAAFRLGVDGAAASSVFGRVPIIGDVILNRVRLF